MVDHLRLSYLSCGPSSERSTLCTPGISRELNVLSYWFCWFHQGKASCSVKGKTYQLGPDDILVLQPGHFVKWKVDPVEPTLKHHFAFEITSAPPHWLAPAKWPIVRRMPREDIIRPLFEYVMAYAPHDAIVVPPTIEAAIEIMLSAFISDKSERTHTFPRFYPPPVQRVLNWIFEFMSSTPGKKVTLDDMAEVSGVSRAQLCRLFVKYLKHAPLDVLYLYRITRSLHGLRSGEKLESLAHDLGFADVAHYSRRFKALYGKSPSAMREAMTKGFIPEPPDLPWM